MTGDVGEWVDGTHVRIVDRIKHIIITSGGKNISPSEIENSLKTSPYVNEAMVVGEGRKYLTALIGIELDTVGDWALRRGLPYTTYRDLSEKPEVDRADPGGRRPDQREVRPGREHQEVRLAAQGARSRGRRVDGHPEAQAVGDDRRVRRSRRGDVLMARYKLDSSQPSHLLALALIVGGIVFSVYQLVTAADIFFATLMKSLALGSVYALIALGFVLIFKATEVVNFSQGALAMIGVLFISFMVADQNLPIVGFFVEIPNPIYDLPGPEWLLWGLSVIVALCFSALLGLVIERLAIRPMIGQPLFSVAVITLGLEIALRALANDAVKINFRSVERSVGIRRFQHRRRLRQLVLLRGDDHRGGRLRRRVLLLPLPDGNRHAGRGASIRKPRWRRASTSVGSSRSPGEPARCWRRSAACSPPSHR